MGGGRRSQQRDRGDRGPKPPKVIFLEKKEDIKLHHAENAWKPGLVAPNKPDDSEANQTEVCYLRYWYCFSK